MHLSIFCLIVFFNGLSHKSGVPSMFKLQTTLCEWATIFTIYKKERFFPSLWLCMIALTLLITASTYYILSMKHCVYATSIPPASRCAKVLLADKFAHLPWKLIARDHMSKRSLKEKPYQINIDLPSKTKDLIHFLPSETLGSNTSLEAIQRMTMAFERLKFIVAAAT